MEENYVTICVIAGTIFPKADTKSLMIPEIYPQRVVIYEANNLN